MGSADSSSGARARKRAPARRRGARTAADSSRRSDVEVVFRQRLNECIQGSSVAAFARRADIPDSTLRSYVDGSSLPSLDTAVKIARAAGRPLDWFANAVDIGDLRTEQLGAGYDADFVLLPLYDVRASAGHGAWNDDERVSRLLAFNRKWLVSDLRVSPDSVVLIYVDGDSMAPTLSDGDVVMVDRSQSQLRSDGMYVFTHDGALLIKRLQRLAGGTVRVISDNERFKEYELRIADFESDEAPAALIGRVLWSGVRV
jgi:phage repressor protein C with HTH and peptisase S24 domain